MRLRPLGLVAALTLVGCGHKMDGPTPTIAMLSPAAICNALDTTVTLTGSNFVPVPEQVLKTSVLVLPTVTLTLNGQATTIDPASVTWVSDTQMTFIVHASLMLAPGVYDVTVTNPTGKSVTAPGALTISPPPTIASIVPSTIYNGVDNTITITGTGFQMMPTVSIAAAGAAAITLAATFVDAEHVTAVVPKGTPAGVYTLTLANPDGCTATGTLTITDQPPVAVTGIISPFGCSSDPKGTPVTISGAGFISTPTALLVGADAGGGNLALKNVAFVSATKLTGIVPSGGKIGGPYDLTVTNPDGTSATLAKAFTITSDCPPVVDDVEPNQVTTNYKTSSPGTPIILTGSNFHSDATVVLVNQSGQEIMLPNAAATVNGAGTQISLAFDASAGGSALTAGVYLVRVKDTDAAPPTGTGATMWGDYSLFVVTQPSGKFTAAVAAKVLPMGRRGEGVVGGQLNAAARFLYAIAGDSGGATLTTLADGLVAPLDLFGDIGDAGWLPLRKMAAAPASSDTPNLIGTASGGTASPRTGVGIAQWNDWVYVVGGTKSLTATAAMGAPFSPASPTNEVWKAHILSSADAPTVSATASVGGLPAGTYYYKVATLLAANTPNYGPDPAETAASDEQVVTVGAGGAVMLTFAASTAAGAPPAGDVVGFRIYRSPMANGVSQSEVFIHDVPAGATSYVDSGDAPGMAHPLVAGMLSEWEPGPALAVPRAYPGVTVVQATPNATATPLLYVIGGASSSSAVEKTYEVSPLSSGTAGAFAPALTGANDCTSEVCMAAGRWSLFADNVTQPVTVTNPATQWVIAGAGVVGSGSIIEAGLIDSTSSAGLIKSWAPVAADGGFAFTIPATTYGAIGFYENGYLAVVDGYGNGQVQGSNDEFTSLFCSTALNMAGQCPADTPFKQGDNTILKAKSNSGLGIKAPLTPIAWPGYTISSGYIYIVGGTSNGTNAIDQVVQGAQ